jgi:hypothetical protein
VFPSEIARWRVVSSGSSSTDWRCRAPPVAARCCTAITGAPVRTRRKQHADARTARFFAPPWDAIDFCSGFEWRLPSALVHQFLINEKLGTFSFYEQLSDRLSDFACACRAVHAVQRPTTIR